MPYHSFLTRPSPLRQATTADFVLRGIYCLETKSPMKMDNNEIQMDNKEFVSEKSTYPSLSLGEYGLFLKTRFVNTI